MEELKRYSKMMNSNFSRFAANYKLNIEKSSATLEIIQGNMQQFLLNMAKTSVKKFKFQYLTAISFSDNGTIIAWFNNQALHSAALALDLVHNAIIKAFCGADHSIHVHNAPLKFLPKNDSTPDIFENIDGFGYIFACLTGLVMSILSASYISYYIKVSQFHRISISESLYFDLNNQFNVRFSFYFVHRL